MVIIAMGLFTGTWMFFGLWLLTGFCIAGIGLGIMHDANHGSVTKNMKVNAALGKLINVIGGDALNWKIQHNVLHHTFTNIDGFDEDIDPGGTLRFSPHQPRKAMHKFQFIYAWFLYGLMTIFWITFKDFVQLARYEKKGLVAAKGTTYKKELIKMIFNKVVYYIYAVIIPLVFLPVGEIVSVGMYIGGFLLAHFVAGVTLGIVFQPAHVIPEVEYPLPDENLSVEGNWAIHQLMTTADFAQNNPIVNWYVGGLNFQIEHHLFPNISHVHYKPISKIVKQTAAEYGLPYHNNKTFIGAVINHGKMLFKLGRA
ncbi:MAG: acyl-CoA desaturase [Flavobacteriales bacterium]|nr:acyl-CoA desaturase [Flavobacteriales bacterium]